MTKLTKLFEPIKIGQLELKNRIVMLAMGTGFSGYRVNDRLIDYYVSRAKGGVGLIIIPAAPCPGDMATIPGVFNDSFVPGLNHLARSIQSNGAKAMLQMIVLHRWSRDESVPGEVVGPSEMMNRLAGKPARSLTPSEIDLIVKQYGEAARRVREAGFDGLELHLGMGFLLSRFLSSATNKRTDQYGGSLTNRMRFILEIIHEMKNETGENYPLSCRFSADEFMEGGHTLAESREVARGLEAAGAHMLNVQAGWEESPLPMSDMSVPRGAFVYLSEAIKKCVQIPVVAAYRINDPILAEEILEKGQADLIGMGRPLLADPGMPQKAKAGNLDEIRHCIACNHCLDVSFEGLTSGKALQIECTVNPGLGREAEVDLLPAKRRKKVIVVGGSPGGMQAAQVAAKRGHKVIIYDKNDKLGGQLLLATIPPHKEEIGTLIDWLNTSLKKTGVDICLGTTVTAHLIDKEKPDVVILATGAVPRMLNLSGEKLSNVITALDVLSGKKQVKNKAIIIGGGSVGCETAEFLVQKGKQVTILEMLPRIGNDIGLTTRWVILNRLKKAKVRMETGARAEEITEKGVRVTRHGASEFFEADTIVIAVGLCSDGEPVPGLKNDDREIYRIGDCVEPRRIRQAIVEGFEIGSKI